MKNLFEYDLHARTCKDQNEMALHSTVVYLSQDSHNCHWAVCQVGELLSKVEVKFWFILSYWFCIYCIEQHVRHFFSWVWLCKCEASSRFIFCISLIHNYIWRLTSPYKSQGCYITFFNHNVIYRNAGNENMTLFSDTPSVLLMSLSHHLDKITHHLFYYYNSVGYICCCDIFYYYIF